MRAVIYERKEIENGSLLLKALAETGKTGNFKIPGILKSKTRNSYFMAPATLWDFTLCGNNREVVTPKEYNLIHSPYDFNTGYRELTRLSEVIKPLARLKPELEMPALFNDITGTLYDWVCGDEIKENILINRFYLKFLEHMGLLHHSMRCVHCGSPLTEADHYHLFSGSICAVCLREQMYREGEFIPNAWLNNGLAGISTHGTKEEEAGYRGKILNFLKIST